MPLMRSLNIACMPAINVDLNSTTGVWQCATRIHIYSGTYTLYVYTFCGIGDPPIRNMSLVSFLPSVTFGQYIRVVVAWKYAKTHMYIADACCMQHRSNGAYRKHKCQIEKKTATTTATAANSIACWLAVIQVGWQPLQPLQPSAATAKGGGWLAVAWLVCWWATDALLLQFLWLCRLSAVTVCLFYF